MALSFAIIPSGHASAEEGAQQTVVPQAFLTALSSAGVPQKRIPFDVKLWVVAIEDGRTDDAVHNWATVSPKIPEPMRPAADVLFLYLLWKSDLPQTFVDELVNQLRRPELKKNAAWATLKSEVGPKLAGFLFDEGVALDDQQKAFLEKMPWQGLAIDLKAWSLLKAGERVRPALQHMAKSHPWRHLLEASLALSLAKKGELRAALNLLEPAATDKENPHYPYYALQIARLHFERADLKKAEHWYASVPTDAPEAVAAREEMLWIWLRTNQSAKLRGTVESLRTEEFEHLFLPELFVVRSISNLKLCRFDQVKDDFDNFLAYNRSWAERIDKNLKSPKAEEPPHQDIYASLVTRALDSRQTELKRLKEFHKASIAAALPAVGRQEHWEKAIQGTGSRIALLKKNKVSEHQRQWRNQAAFLREAIRKMRFVKVELLSQLSSGIEANAKSPTSDAQAEKVDDTIVKESEGNWSFPFDGVVWPDELFALRSDAHNICL